ncbi:MAG: nuclear transport factor 2 family protein [Pyrinomonadaceae bacterium]
MKKIRTSLFTFFVTALILLSPPASAAAQEKEKEGQKPASSTVDAWRQALPPQAETGDTPEESAAATQQQRVTREMTEKALVALERKWMGALQQRDASALSQIISADFTLVSPRLVMAAGDRDRYFQHAMRDLSLTSYDFEGVTVRTYGRTAVVSGRLTQSAVVAGEDWGGTYLFTDVWVSRDGTWQVVSRHTSPLPTQKR